MAGISPITVSGTVTSYLPLTTAWPSYAGCESQVINNDPGTTVTAVFYFDPKYANVVPGVPTCLPPEVSSWWYQTQTDTGQQRPTVTSLGGYDFSCPELYSTVYSSTASDLMTTVIGCCPSNFALHGATTQPVDLPNQCFSSIPSTVLTYAQLSSAGTYTITSDAVPAGFIAGVQVNGYIFKNTAAPTASTAPAGTTTINPAGNITSSSSGLTASSGSSGTSSGAKAGIGIGVALVAVAALLGAAYLFRRKRRAAAANRVTPADLGNVYHDAEHGGNIQPEKKVEAVPVELIPNERPLEMDGASNYDDLDKRAELA